LTATTRHSAVHCSINERAALARARPFARWLNAACLLLRAIPSSRYALFAVGLPFALLTAAHCRPSGYCLPRSALRSRFTASAPSSLTLRLPTLACLQDYCLRVLPHVPGFLHTPAVYLYSTILLCLWLKLRYRFAATYRFTAPRCRSGTFTSALPVTAPHLRFYAARFCASLAVCLRAGRVYTVPLAFHTPRYNLPIHHAVLFLLPRTARAYCRTATYPHRADYWLDYGPSLPGLDCTLSRCARSLPQATTRAVQFQLSQDTDTPPFAHCVTYALPGSARCTPAYPLPDSFGSQEDFTISGYGSLCTRFWVYRLTITLPVC